MNPAHNEAEIFMEALELDDPGERAAFVQRACAGDSTLLKRVEGLLGRQSRLGRFLESPAVATDPCAQGPIWGPEGPGTMIGGRYKLLEQIGEGGFGVVYLAEQQEPVRRQVALKIIKPGMDTRQVIARFEAERQALALMDHPNIAKVLDGGVINARGASAKSEIPTLKSQIPAGRPYFVMERVRGQPITQFCEDHQLPIRDRLELFIAVCHAIQHAHQKGIIHRDIKPSNVLVTLDHGAPHPMVIDFGVAKALEQPLTERTLHTRFGQMIGTPAYMSPEQADLSRQDVDTRSDVYGLGILLYELLTGTTPFPEERLRTAGLAGILRILHEEEPLRPSTTVSRMNGRLRALALNRRSEPAALIQLIQGDLDWIVLKAIEKDRRRRYDSPADLAADVRRHLADEPVLARPPSTVYQLRKFARRHQVLVTATAVIAVMLVLTAAFSVWQALRATRAQAVAEEQRQEAAQQAAIAAAMNEFLTEDLLRQADVWKAEAHASPNRDIRLLEIVDRASEGVDAKFGNQPLVAAKIHMTVGSVYAGLGETDKAEHHLRTAKRLFEEQVGPDDPRTLEASHALAVLLRVNRAAYGEAETLIRHVFNTRQRNLGTDHRDTLAAMIELAQSRKDREAHDEAEALFDTAMRQAGLAFGSDDPLTLSALEGVISTMWGRGEREAATHTQRELWQTRKRIQGEAHPDTLHTLASLTTYIVMFEQDYPVLEQLVANGLNLSGPLFGEHGTTHTFELMRSVALLHKGLFKEVIDLRQRLFDSAVRNYGRDHERTLGAQFFLGYHYCREGGDDERAIEIFEDALARFAQVAPDSGQVGRDWLANLLWRLGHWDEALVLRQQYLEIQHRLYGPESESTRSAIRALATLWARMGNWGQGAPLLADLARKPKPNVRDCANAALIHALVDQPREAAEFASLALAAAAESLNPIDRTHLLITVFLTHSPDFGLRSTPTVLRDLLSVARTDALEDASPGERRLLSALAAITTQQWPTATEQLRAVADGSPEDYLRATAGFLLAAALHRRGLAAEASQQLAVASHTLERLAASGDLGRRWDEFAVSLLARGRASAELRMPAPGPVIDQHYLAEAQSRWQPVRATIDQAFLFARHRRWAEASDALKSAMAHEAFAWEAADQLLPRWSLKLALIFASAEDWDAYQQFCNSQYTDPDLTPSNLKAVTLFPTTAHPGFDQTFLLDAAGMVSLPETEGRRRAPGWMPLLNGLTLLHQGRATEAEEELKRAQESYNLHCACAAFAYGAQLHAQQGDLPRAAAQLERAEAILDRLYENHGDDLGGLWFELRLCELAVEAARRMADEMKEASQ